MVQLIGANPKLNTKSSLFCCPVKDVRFVVRDFSEILVMLAIESIMICKSTDVTDHRRLNPESFFQRVLASNRS